MLRYQVSHKLLFGIAVCFLMAYTIATLNVNGLRNPQKREIVFEYLLRKKVAIVFLQETHSEVGDESTWRRQWGGQIAFSHGTTNSCGVAILISQKSGLHLINFKNDSNGRWVKGDIAMGGEVISLISLYAPNNATIRKHFYERIGRSLSDIIEDYNCIIGGDFNCDINADIYDQSRKCLLNVIQENDLIDTGGLLSKENNPVLLSITKGSNDQAELTMSSFRTL